MFIFSLQSFTPPPPKNSIPGRARVFSYLLKHPRLPLEANQRDSPAGGRTAGTIWAESAREKRGGIQLQGVTAPRWRDLRIARRAALRSQTTGRVFRRTLDALEESERKHCGLVPQNTTELPPHGRMEDRHRAVVSRGPKRCGRQTSPDTRGRVDAPRNRAAGRSRDSGPHREWHRHRRGHRNRVHRTAGPAARRL